MKERISFVPGETEQQQSPVAPVDINDYAALRALAKGKLVAIIQECSPTPALVSAIKELLDRVDGKAKEQVHITGNVALFDVKGGAELIMEGIRDKLAKRKPITIENDEVQH